MPAPPFTSATDAIESFASTACCVGLTRASADGPAGTQVYAPFGLDDGFAMHMSPHRRLAPPSVYDAKVTDDRRRWPSLTSDPW